jgi:hypothetical protein
MTYISPNCETALGHARNNCPVFPCAASGLRAKRPLTEHGHHEASTDESRILDWWRRFPNALVGSPAGRFWVVDVDGRQGREGLRGLLTFLELGTVADLTPIVSRTPSDGLHLFFKLGTGTTPRNRASDIGPGIDTRGVHKDGRSAGHIIAPGTMLPDGRSYRLVDPSDLCAVGGSL